MEYKSKFRGQERSDWKEVQTEWMKYCLMLKYRDNALFRKDLFACHGKLPVEDATGTNYASNLFWGADPYEVDAREQFVRCGGYKARVVAIVIQIIIGRLFRNYFIVLIQFAISFNTSSDMVSSIAP